MHDFAPTVIAGTLAPGDDADDARWVTGPELDSLPVTANLAEYLRGAGILT